MNKKAFKEQAKYALEECQIVDNKDRTINLIGDLYVTFPFEYLPKIKFLDGNFYCCNNPYLKTLEGMPENITKTIECVRCDHLKTLEGAPKYVKNFRCYQCKSLETLKGLPTINGNLDCDECKSLPPNAKTEWQKNKQYSKKEKILKPVRITKTNPLGTIQYERKIV